MTVAALYVDPSGPYMMMDDVEPWCGESSSIPMLRPEAARNAMLYNGPHPIVAHPPCGHWGRLAHMCRRPISDKVCGAVAVEQVRRWGGVIEHPAGSRLWDTFGLPKPGESGFGFTVEVEQVWWGHKARKSTWLWFHGVPKSIAEGMIENSADRSLRPTHVVTSSLRVSDPSRLPSLSSSENHLTPPRLARVLVDVAGLASEGPRVAMRGEF